MVRLKVQKGDRIMGLCNKFQFHYGSVKSLDASFSVPETPSLFQFHYGSVKRMGLCNNDMFAS